MQNTMNQELTISLVVTTANPDADFMVALSTSTGDFSLILQVSPNDVIQSTGMVAIHSGVVTPIDVGRALEAAMSLLSSTHTVLHASPTCIFVVNDRVQTELMPIGIPGKKLEVKVALVRISTGILQRWCDWANALGRNVVGWRVEIIFDES